MNTKICTAGGTGKDRAAKMMLIDAMATGKLPARNGIVVEGTSGR
jgi:cysteine synthase